MAAKHSSLTRSITLALGVFGGVQLVTILCAVIRAKLISIWIGPLGVGLLAIYWGALEMVLTFTQLSLRQSAVRDLAQHPADAPATNLIVAAIRWCGRWLGVAGFVVMAAISPLLSLWTFGDYAHWLPFAITAIALLFLGNNSAQLAIMQGLKRLRLLASATLWGAVATIAISVPLFFWWRQDSIVPVLVVGAAVTMGASRWGLQRMALPPQQIQARQAWEISKSFLVLGFYITLTSALNQLAAYALISFLNDNFDTEVVGFYRAGYTIVNSYIGVVFTAIAMEYYPRLSSQIQAPTRTSTIVSHEISIALWALMPIVCILIAADTLIVRLLYSSQFLAITPYITLAMVGVMLRAPSWCMAFVILARNNGRIFLLTEGLSEAIFLATSLLGFVYGPQMCTALGIPVHDHLYARFAGLGMAYTIWYAMYYLIIATVYFRHYRLRFGAQITGLIIVAIATAIAAIAARYLIGWYAPLIIAIILLPLTLRRLQIAR